MSTVDQVAIVNSALFSLGADRIQSITQNTTPAIVANEIYGLVRDEVQCSHPWNFTMRRATWAPNGDTPDHQYTYVYDLPSDYLTLWEVVPHDIEYTIEQRQLLCDESELDVVYGARNEDESSWDNLFAEAMAWRLATKMAYKLTKSLPLMDYCDRKYKETLTQARWRDGVEGRLLELEADTWIRARR